MFGKLRDVWAKWRETSRQHAIERALYKAGGGRGTREGSAAATEAEGAQATAAAAARAAEVAAKPTG